MVECPATDQGQRLVFLEFIDEAKVFVVRFKNQLKARPQDFYIVTFHPSVKAFLLEHGINSTDSFHFCSTDSHRTLIDLLQTYTDQIRINLI